MHTDFWTTLYKTRGSYNLLVFNVASRQENVTQMNKTTNKIRKTVLLHYLEVKVLTKWYETIDYI
jgi:hypothetical protein